MSEPSNLVSKFQKLRVEASKIQNEFKEKPSYTLFKETLDISEKLLEKQFEFNDEMKQIQQNVMSELKSVKKELKQATSIKDLLEILEIIQKIFKKQDEFQQVQENQNKSIENLNSELKTVKAELNETKKQQESQEKLIDNSDKNLKLILESILKFQKSQDQIMMKIMEGSAVQDVPLGTVELTKIDPFFEILVIWTESCGIFASENHWKLRVCGSDTIRHIKLRINSLAKVDISSFRMVLRGKLLEDHHSLAYYNIQEGALIWLYSR
ncbi:Ubiquitin-like domain-containing protein [Caenorhabditis elegans]|uniref:Ubiquitin-like domain-containing protein n=1 Tax=Caenorhabditis elegans TaxID=6239 RepID=P91055_CAEEL|nr:Ubiquitin-like domain-containing protein [Caenorhabditis elegans]CCD64710.1 Ubiquitin-like domain-containing protein [Caenorhabditis elegans]|eukprot:NP_494544.2 Uncharacterized protein CELE_C16C8.16 [Caenorhabditis elegans]